MPGKKTYKKKYKRPGYRACGKMVYGDASRALSYAKGLRRLLNIEIKNHDVQQTTVNLGTVPIITQLTNIPQGDTTITRDGAQCKMIGVDFNYMIQGNTASTIQNVRIMLVVDKQTNQAIYLHTDLLEDITVSDNMITPRNLDNKHRFQVLYDRNHSLGTDSTSVVVRKYIKKDLLLRYDASTPSIADLTQNSLSLVQWQNDGGNLPSITSFIRIRFVDN